MAVEKQQSFGAWLRELRQQKGWTQVDLGRAIGFDNTMVSRVELDERAPKADFVVALARGLDLDPRYVFAKAGIEFAGEPLEDGEGLRGELMSVFEQLGDDDRVALIEMAKALKRSESKRGQKLAGA